MARMHSLIVVLAVAMTGALPASIASAADMSGKLVGTWKVVKAEGPYAKSNMGRKYVFNKDGTMKVSWNKGKWSLKDALLKFHYGKVVVPSDISFADKDTLVIKIHNSQGQVLTLKRQ